MPNNPEQTRPSRDGRIDLGKQEEVKYWAEQFGVPEQELRQAVEYAGPLVEDVRARLSRNRSY